MTKREYQRMQERHRYWPGVNSELRTSGFGASVRPRVSSEWQHPWQVQMDWALNDEGVGEWRATINPGFVNGRPAFIDMPAEWLAGQVSTGQAQQRDFGINPLTGRNYFEAWVFNHATTGAAGSKASGPGGPVRITNLPTPYLVFSNWRNPIAPGSLSASDAGGLVVGAGEGYPRFFESLGVRPASKGGRAVDAGAEGRDPSRTRELRAMDIVLIQPRLGTRLDYVPGDPIGDVATAQISTAYLSDYVNLHNGRTRLRATAKYQPPGDPNIETTFGILLNAGDPQFDELLMATVWMVSPPDAGSDAIPDATWEPYVQHKVFWNLNHAPRNIPRGIEEDPLIFILPLALGTAQGVVNGIISVLNGMLNEALAFLRQGGDTRGNFWTT